MSYGGIGSFDISHEAARGGEVESTIVKLSDAFRHELWHVIWWSFGTPPARSARSRVAKQLNETLAPRRGAAAILLNNFLVGHLPSRNLTFLCFQLLTEALVPSIIKPSVCAFSQKHSVFPLSSFPCAQLPCTSPHSTCNGFHQGYGPLRQRQGQGFGSVHRRGQW